MLPQIENYLPESSFRAMCDLDNPLFGRAQERVKQLDKLETLSRQKIKPYKLYLVDDFRLQTDPELAVAVAGAETIALVGDVTAAGNDFDCGAVSARRGSDFRVRWSKAREKVNAVKRVFELLALCSPRLVTADEIKQAAGRLERGKAGKKR